MTGIFAKVTHGRWLDLWYHFAIMFEALFILTTIDAGTRAARYILQDFLGNLWKPLGNTRRLGPNLLASGLMVAAWGYFLIQGVRDPLGGINSLWPLFGIANQMLAAIALCLATTIILKTQLVKAGEPGGRSRPAFALLTFLPLVWLVAVTFTAGVQKIWHSDVRIGFLAQAASLEAVRPALEEALELSRTQGVKAAIAAAEMALRSNEVQIFNNRLDAVVAGAFLLLVLAILALGVREWWLLLSRRKAAQLRECEPVWLPAYALKEALALGLAKELSGEAALERARQPQIVCADHHSGATSDGQHYVNVSRERFNGIRRCC
jgi:carbon starvation protein